MRAPTIAIALTIATLAWTAPITAETIALGPTRDATLYEDADADLANGAGQFLFAGSTNRQDLRRALVHFDVAGSIPAGSTVTEVRLSLQMSKSLAGSVPVSLHRVLEDWGEAGSMAGQGEGVGAPAEEGDATWAHRFYPDQLWTDQGGTFAASASAQTEVGGLGIYTWGSNATLVAEVQAWVDGVEGNYGWILLSGEDLPSPTAKRFNSSENDDPASRPTLTITYEGGAGAPLDHRFLIPAAAAVAGFENSFFLTDLEVNNLGADAVDFQLRWLPRGTDNSDPMGSEILSVSAGASLHFTDVVRSAFGLQEGVGALVVTASSDSLAVVSRTYNVSETGTFGQGFVGLGAGNLVSPGERVRVISMVENDDFRSNLGIVSAVDQPITVAYELFAADGTSLGTSSVELAPMDNTQLNRLFAAHAPIESGYVEVWSDTTGARFTCYGSVLDNRTSDPTTIPYW